jgi:putative transposase
MVIRKRLPITGRALVYVTTTVTDWTPIFHDREAAILVIKRLSESLNYFSVSAVGYVVMPSHLHLLLGFIQIEMLSRFIQSFKILTSKAVKSLPIASTFANLWKADNFNLWKPRFDDLIIVSEEQFRIKLNYIHNNPVKAGLVSDPCDWPYSSASAWLKDRPGLLQIDKTFGWTN